MSELLGIHHVTAIASDPQRNVDFYTRVLGLRLVKRTVNYDDPFTYHLYYGDATGTPGTLITFFAWPMANRGRVGPKQVAVTSLAVLPSAIAHWVERLIRFGIPFERPTRRAIGGDVERVLTFRDPDGLLLEIVGHPSAESRRAESDDAIRGVHGVTLWEEHAEATERVLVDTLGMRAAGEHEATRRFTVGGDGVGTRVDVRTVGGFVEGVQDPGTVHHVAFRLADEASELTIRERVAAAGLHATEVLDRSYFRSVYFREPGGVLVELATDGPGFAVDESAESLGTRLVLPPRYEAMRNQIEMALPPVHYE